MPCINKPHKPPLPEFLLTPLPAEARAQEDKHERRASRRRDRTRDRKDRDEYEDENSEDEYAPRKPKMLEAPSSAGAELATDSHVEPLHADNTLRVVSCLY